MEIGFIRHEMQRLRVVLNFRNDYVAVNQTTTHLPSLSGAAQSLWNNQDMEWVSVAVSVAFRVTGKMRKMTLTHASLVKWTIRAHLVSPRNCESIQNILDGPLVCSCKEWWVYTDRPPVSKISLSKTATACQLHEENRPIGEAKSDTFWKFLRDNSDAQ